MSYISRLIDKMQSGELIAIQMSLSYYVVGKLSIALELWRIPSIILFNWQGPTHRVPSSSSEFHQRKLKL